MVMQNKKEIEELKELLHPSPAKEHEISPAATITISPSPDTTPRKTIEAEDIEDSLRVDEGEKELIRRALDLTNGNRKEAAARLGFSERTLYRKIKEYGL
jgi:DNA-binding NtrC family response regulator